jgi:ABC-2 type transport system permease protein
MFASVLRTAINDGATDASLEGGIVGLFGTMTGVDIITLGIQFAELTVAVLGVLLITSEYTSGMIKATFTAAPHRISVLISKIIVLLGTTAIIGVVGVTLSWLVTRGLLSGLDNIDPISFSDPNQVRALGGTVLYLMAVAILAFGIGALVRATSAGIFAAVAVLTVIPVILNYVLMGSNAAWATNLYKFLPTVAGEQVYSFTPDEAMFARDVLGPWAGFLVLLGYGLLTVIVAAVLLRRRDA